MKIFVSMKALALWAGALVFNQTWAQAYPARSIRLVVTTPGGGSDFIARLLSPHLSLALGQQVIVDNRGGTVVPIEITVKAQPDGYTLLYYGGTLWLLPLMQKVSYDPLRDLAPITLAVNSPVIASVHPALPVRTIKDLIALARSKPGTLNFAAAGNGSPAHLSMELFKSMAGLDMVRVPYKGSGPALTALIAGEIQISMNSSGGVAPHINSGKVRGLAVTSARRSASFPNLPTIAESGLPGYESGQLSGFFAPARTPAAIVDRINKEVVQLVHRPDIKEKLFAGATEPEGTTPQQAVARIKAEVVRMSKVIKDANIRMEQ